MNNLYTPSSLATFSCKRTCNLLLVLLLLAETTSAQDYCQYCFSFIQNDAQRRCEISNVFAYPTTQYPGSSGFYCYANYQQAQNEQTTRYNRFAAAKYVVSVVQQKDYCDPVQERSRAEQAQWQQKQDLEYERLQYHAEQERKKKEEEQSRSDRLRRKEDIERFYQSLSPKPKSIAKGWHFVTLVTGKDEIIEQRRVYVENNRVTQMMRARLPLYDSVYAVTSGPVAEGKIVIESRGEFFDAYFFDYIKNAESKAPPPDRDARSLWLYTQALPMWRDALSGANAGCVAYTDKGGQLRFSDNHKENFDAIGRVTRLEMAADRVKYCVPVVLDDLRKSPYPNLSRVAFTIVGSNYKINFSSIEEFEKMREQAEIFGSVLNEHWRKLLTGGLSAPHGAYIGDKRVVLDRSNLSATDFAMFAKITKLWINSADAVRDERIPKSERTRQDFRVTGKALPRDKRINVLLENVQILSFDNTDLTIDDLTDYEMPPFAKVRTLQACNTAAAKKWGGMSGKKQEALLTKMKNVLPNFETISSCKK